MEGISLRLTFRQGVAARDNLGRKMEILTRLYKIAKSSTVGYVQSLGKAVGKKSTGTDRLFAHSSGGDGGGGTRADPSGEGTKAPIGIPLKVIEDLAIFELKPPSSMDEVKRARNREIKKYHSDKFVNDLEKLGTSKEIMQIYNGAYERLKKYYGSIGKRQK